MKKFFIIFPVILTLIAGAKELAKMYPAEKPVNKSINLSIYRDDNYSSAAYDSTIASVHITISKVTGSKLTVMYDKTLSSMQLNKFPGAQNALISNLIIPDLLNSKEKLLINYTITYSTQGSTLTFSNNVMSSAAQKENLKITI